MINEKKVMDTIRANPGLTMTELSELLGTTEAQVRQRARFLRKYGLISSRPVPSKKLKNTMVMIWYAEEV
jgi:DNA-binding MarR family transcriptional regulator